MTIAALRRKLKKLYGGRVSVELQRGCALLTGELDDWGDIVNAGRLAVSRKRLGVVNDIRLAGASFEMKVPPVNDLALEGESPDVLVIGAGIVGAAIARELTRYDLSVLLVDKEHDVALHASSRNDGAVHPGADLKRGQLKRLYNHRGNRMYGTVSAELGVPFERSGQYLCFHKNYMKPVALIASLYLRTLGVHSRIVPETELRTLEPQLPESARFALCFPDAGITCPYGMTIAYAENAVQNGARISLDTAVTGMELSGESISAVHTNRGTLHPAVVVNAAGVFSDKIAEMANDRFFTIHPRRGTNTILDKKSRSRAHLSISSFGFMDTRHAHTKGGGIVMTVDGNVLIGPDAVETPERENFATFGDGVGRMMAKQCSTLPSIGMPDIITYFTGVRAATYEEDFVITKGKFTRNIVHVAGIQSPGVTAAPAIGVDVAEMAVSLLSQRREIKPRADFDPVRVPIPRLRELPDDERDALIKKNPDYGVMVCRCEEISRGEILDALNRNVPCDSVDGVKRRVRAGMGRCQGGFCGPAVTRIIAQHKGIPLDSVLKSGYGSEILCGDTKEEGQ